MSTRCGPAAPAECQAGERIRCRYFTFSGYFGFGPDAQKIYDLYPYGGFCEYMTAPQYALVQLPDSVSFEQAARFGYIGTSYAAMKKADAGAGQSMLVDGISGTLGLGAALLGLAMGMTRILGTGRNRALLERVKALAPERIEVHALGDGRPRRGPSADQRRRRRLHDQRARSRLAASTMLEFIAGRPPRRPRRQCRGVAEPVPVDVHWLMDEQIQFIGRNWFTAAQGQEMAELARVGVLDLSCSSTSDSRSKRSTTPYPGCRTATAGSATTLSCLDPRRAGRCRRRSGQATRQSGSMP